MELSYEKINRMLSKAFDYGQNCTLDMKIELIEEICKDFNIKNTEEILRNWTLEELKNCPIGSIFHHVQYGRCWVVGDDREKYMQFRSGRKAKFEIDSDPWNMPMKLIQLGD